MSPSFHVFLSVKNTHQFNLRSLINYLAKITVRFLSVSKGVFTGYSAMSVAMALPPDGRVVACDISQEYTDVGKPFWKEVSRMERFVERYSDTNVVR